MFSEPYFLRAYAYGGMTEKVLPERDCLPWWKGERRLGKAAGFLMLRNRLFYVQRR